MTHVTFSLILLRVDIPTFVCFRVYVIEIFDDWTHDLPNSLGLFLWESIEVIEA